jgi:ABC-type iron transport system FetAB permease component
METKTLEEMSEEEFDTLLDKIEEDDFDKVTPQAFGEALWALQEQKTERVIELTAEVVEGSLRFEPTEVIPVNGNEIILGDTRVRIRLKPIDAHVSRFDIRLQGE